MVNMKVFILMTHLVCFSLSLLAEVAPFLTSDGKTLQNPTLVRQLDGKAVVLHDEGVEFLDLNPAVTDFFKTAPVLPQIIVPALKKNTVESWLIEIETQAKVKARPVTTPVRKIAPQKAPAVELKTTLTAKEFSSVYYPADYDGVDVNVSGTVTSIIEGNGMHTIVLDNVVAFSYETEDRVRSRAMDGSPKSTGNYSVGVTSSISGTCSGRGSDGIININ